MAAKATLVGRSLGLKIKTGVDTKGNDKFTVKKMNGVKVAATDQNILDTSTVLGSVLKYPLTECQKLDQFVVVNE